MIFKPIEALSIAALSIGSPVVLGGLFDFLNPPVEPAGYSNIECSDTYANATYLTREQIGYLQSGQYRFWSDIGQPFCRVKRSGTSEWYLFLTQFKSNLGVIVQSDSQAVLLSWDFAIEPTSIGPEPIIVTPVVTDVEQPHQEQYAATPQPQQQSAIDCVPYP